MNIFEGSRRIASIIAGFIIIASLIAIHGNEKTIRLYYKSFNLGESLIRSQDDCRFGIDGIESKEFVAASGTSYRVQLCFPASKADNGALLVPYKAEGSYFLMNGPYDADVRAHMQHVMSTYTPSAADESDADSQYWKNLANQWFYGLSYLAIGLFFYWLVVRAIGWVMRGFMGVPAGADSK